MYNQIIIPLDFNDKSKTTLYYGIALANALETKAIIITATRDTSNGGTSYYTAGFFSESKTTKNEIIKEQNERYVALINSIVDKFDNFPDIEHYFQSGNIAGITNKYVSENPRSIIILPEEQRDNRISDYNNEIVEAGHCPAMVLSRNLKYKNYKKILYATNYNPADLKALSSLSKFAGIFNAEISIIHIANQLDFSEKIKARGFLELAKEETKYQKITMLIESGRNFIEKLDMRSLENQVDMISLLKEDTNFFKSIFSGSVTEGVVNKSDLPVLIFYK